jgi:hypothetical protein
MVRESTGHKKLPRQNDRRVARKSPVRFLTLRARVEYTKEFDISR